MGWESTLVSWEYTELCIGNSISVHGIWLDNESVLPQILSCPISGKCAPPESGIEVLLACIPTRDMQTGATARVAPETSERPQSNYTRHQA